MIIKKLGIVLSIVFGSIFIWSGVVKLMNPAEFANAIRNFELVGDPIAPFLALSLPLLEVVCGVAVVFGKLWRGAAVLLLASLVLFTCALAIAAAKGLDINCGCFGGSESSNYPIAFVRNSGLFAIGLAIIFIKSRKNRIFD